MNLPKRLLSLFRRNQLDAEMAEEMRLHLELQEERNRAAGMNAEEARYAAQRQFGNVGSIQEVARDGWGWRGVEGLIKDLRFAFRHLQKTPAFTLMAVLTLALGIGLSTAAFSLLNVIWLRPLPFEDSGNLMRLRRSTAENPDGSFAPADMLELKRSEKPFGRFAGYADQEVSLAEPGRPAELKPARRISADYFAVLGVRPESGRTFSSREEVYGRHRVAVLSHAFWKSRYGAADAIGRTVRVDGEAVEIIGVLPAWASDARVIRDTALFLPLAFTAKELAARDNRWVGIIGRRSASLNETQANEFVAALGARIEAQAPAGSEAGSWHCEDLRDSTGNSTGRLIVTMLLGLSGCVLLIACSNLANFMLARTIGRSQELAVRAALGASRLRLIRPLIVEALALALAGGVAALPVSLRALHWLSDQSIASGGAPMQFPLDWRVLGFAFSASIFAALFFGVAPALFTLQVDVNATLKRGGRGATASRGHTRLRRFLIVAQFAMALILVAGAGFIARGASNFLRRHVGWDASLIAEGRFELAKSNYPGPAQILAFDRQVLERLRRVLGVQAASLSYGMPYDGLFGPRPYRVEGRDPPPKGQEPMATYNGVTAGYFDVTGIRLLQGRVFTDADTAASAKVVIINESTARALFPEESPIGRRLAVASGENMEWAEIVGVVADVGSLAVYQPPVPFQTYHPFAQEPWLYARFAVRTAGIAPKTVLSTLRGVIAEASPDLPVRQLMTADAVIEHSSFELTMLRNMLGTFALIGLGLAALGVYGVIARDVTQRTGEIGIRVALGASTGEIVRLILGSGVRLVLTGAGLGVVGACGLARLLAVIMPSLEINRELVIGFSPAVLTAIAFGACYLPARKASKLDPVVALRCE